MICRILYLTDPASFASLILINQAWREASQTPHLYAHHLSRCPSYSISNNVIAGPYTENSLSALKKQYALEVKRNLFDAYLRPRKTIINFISTTTSSSAALPGGEAFDFVFSPNGHWTLALSSARIYVIDTASPKISVQRELKVLRRPIAAAILDDGSILAVLSGHHQVNTYKLCMLKLEHVRCITFDNPIRTIALSPEGEVLAAAYDGGIEVLSLANNANANDRREVKCDKVDSLTFSHDGAMLLGTTQSAKIPSTVVLSAPYFTEGTDDNAPSDMISHMWTSQILFPNSSRDCSHAALLPHHSEGDASWTFTYDRVFESFRAVRIDDLRNGTTYFTGPKPQGRSSSRGIKRKLVPSTLPAASGRGELAAAGFMRKDIWLYGIPEGLDISPSIQMDDPNNHGLVVAGGSSRSSTIGGTPAISLTRGESPEIARLPQWQVLVDKYRNVFAKGRKVAEVPGAAEMRWVNKKYGSYDERGLNERLVIAAPGGVSESSPDPGQDFSTTVDGGRLVLLDFDRNVNDGLHAEITIEVGNTIPELLPEENVDIDTEVAILRRRTVKRQQDELLRASVAGIISPSSITLRPSVSAGIPPVPAFSTEQFSATERTVASGAAQADLALRTHNQSMQESEDLDMPYSHTQPRSRTSLYRSATAVVADRQRHPPLVASGRVEYRRPNGQGELPHESDADNWVPPPPPYTRDAEDPPLPEHLRIAAMQQHSEVMRHRVPPLQTRSAVIHEVAEQPANSSTSQTNSTGNHRRSHDRVQSMVSSQSNETEQVEPNHQPRSRWTMSPLSSGRSSTTYPYPDGPLRRPASSADSHSSHSFQKPLTARLTSPISPTPQPVTGRQFQRRSVSLPSSPAAARPTSTLTLSGANLQQRLEYLLPPPPESPGVLEATSETVENRDSLPVRSASSLASYDFGAGSIPSTQQLANLNRRNSQSIPPSARRIVQRPQIITNPQSHRPSPPRGALGAAGSPMSAPAYRTQSPARSLTNRNTHSRGSSYSASTPDLFRPLARRLDTIASDVSFHLYPPRTRSRPRNTETPTFNTRDDAPSQLSTRAYQRTGLFGAKKTKKAKPEPSAYNENVMIWSEGRMGDDEIKKPRGVKCVVM